MGIFRWGSISLWFCKPIYNFFDLLISDDVLGVSILLIVPVGTRYMTFHYTKNIKFMYPLGILSLLSSLRYAGELS